MKSSLIALVMLVTSMTLNANAQIIHGTVKAVDKTATTVTVAVEDGTDAIVYVTDKTIVRPASTASKDVWHGLKAGTRITVHYTDEAARKTAVEVYKLTATGVKATKGALVSVDRGTRTCVVKSADGAVYAFRMTADAAKQVGYVTAKGAVAGTKVTVYYTEKAGKKVAHVFTA